MADSPKDIVKKVKQLRANYLRYNLGDVSTNSNSDVYAYAKGRMYGGWIDHTGRSNSYNEGDLIENPVGIVESIIRDEILSEHRLVVSSVGMLAINSLSFNGSTHVLMYDTENYYANAYVHNIDKDWTAKVSYYEGSTKTCALSSITVLDIDVGDRCYITNIKGDELIDITTFDSSLSSKSSWKMALSLDTKIEAYSLLDQICFEAQLMLYKNYDKYYIKPIGSGSSVGTLTKPLIERNGNKLIDVSLSSIEDVYTDFTIHYAFLANENSYAKTIVCNKDTTNSTYITSSYKTLCSNAEDNYKLKRKLEINLDFIHDEATAAYFLQRIIKEKTKQKTLVGYSGDVQNHIQYEKGDLVKINVPDRITASQNNTTVFLITKQDIYFQRGNTQINFKLVETIT